MKIYSLWIALAVCGLVLAGCEYIEQTGDAPTYTLGGVPATPVVPATTNTVPTNTPPVVATNLPPVSTNAPTPAPDIYWATSRDEAFALARAANKKLIFLEVGAMTCPACKALKNEVVYFTSPPVKQTLLANFVLWFGDKDSATDWQPYLSFAYPIPNSGFIQVSTGKSMDMRSFDWGSGWSSASAADLLYARLQAMAPYY